MEKVVKMKLRNKISFLNNNSAFQRNDVKKNQIISNSIKCKNLSLSF